MTRPDAPTTSSETARKAVLVCDACGHESPVDGDWLVRERTRRGERSRRLHECPHCGTVVSSQPVFRRLVA